MEVTKVTNATRVFKIGEVETKALRGVDLSIQDGEFTALVGPSGSGKTTLGRLLVGLYEPAQGRIRFDGISLAQLELRSLRRQLGVVTQHPHIFGSTIRANIALGNPSMTLEGVKAAARRACPSPRP